MTDAGTPSGHCNELISARRNPPRWFVNLHQIGSTVLPVNLIHPSAYTVVAYQVQGPSCASCTVHLVCVCPSFSSFQPKVLCRRQRRSLVVIVPRVFQPGRVGCPPFILIFVAHADLPLYLRRCRQTTAQNAYFLFHMIPSWIKCFRQLIDFCPRGQYRGSSIVPTVHLLSSCSLLGGRVSPKL